MSQSPGKFSDKDVAACEKHQTADKKDKPKNPMPGSLEYIVPPEVANRLRTASEHSIRPVGMSVLASNVVANLIYMDVGRWSGSASDTHGTKENWGKRRDFGIVYGRLAVLCTYTKDPPDQPPDKSATDMTALANASPEFGKLKTLIEILSSNPDLGPVWVEKAILGSPVNGEVPREDTIYVILGDLHAPVMTNINSTYSEEPSRYSWSEYKTTIGTVPRGPGAAASETRTYRPLSRHYWNGRYDRGLFARHVLPTLARVFGGAGKVISKSNPLSITLGKTAIGAAGVASFLAAPELAPVAAARVGVGLLAPTAMSLAEVFADTQLHDWPDNTTGEISAVEDWFQRYHGTPKKEKGADIFEDAGVDLERWLDLLKTYQKQAGTNPPVRLMQLGDLFDLWIGLKCPFDISKGAQKAEDFPNPDRARNFLEHWMKEALRPTPIKYLWEFDKRPPAVTDPNLKTVFLYGNHDTYMGTLLKPPLRGCFNDDPGLVAEHGHREDEFNRESNAGFGYLLTQAAFAENEVRDIEEPMSSSITRLFGGLWTRLGLIEMALNTCVFERTGEQAPALTFVMGHTHEPALHLVRVVERISPNPPASPPPPTEQPIPSILAFKSEDFPLQFDARATVYFRQIDIVHKGIGGRTEVWNMRAFVRPAADAALGEPMTLLDEVEVNTRHPVELSASIAVPVGWGDRLEIFIQGWPGRRQQPASDPFMAILQAQWDYVVDKIDGLTPDCLKPSPRDDSMSVHVLPFTWSGTQTMACPHFKVSFTLLWEREG